MMMNSAKRRPGRAGLCLLLVLCLFLAGVPGFAAEDSFLLGEDSLLRTGGHDIYMSGDEYGYFRPERVMSRAEAAQMLYNLLADKPSVGDSRFSDVSQGGWYYTAVNALAISGVLNGYTDGSFGPLDNITRAQFVAVLIRCFPGMEAGEEAFADVPESHWAYSAITAAVAAGWINGMEQADGQILFQPDRGITRCEAVKIMNLALGRTGTEGYAARRGSQSFPDVGTGHWAYLDISEAAKPVDNPKPLPTPTPAPTPAPTATPTPSVGGFTVGSGARVTASSGLRLRSEPNTNTNNNIITTLSYGTVVTVTGVGSYPWLAVRTSAGQTGYICAVLGGDTYAVPYTISQPTPAPTPSSTTNPTASPAPAAAGAQVNPGSVSLHRYQTVRVDGSVTRGLSLMSWRSSNPSVAFVGYTVNYGSSNTQGAMIYGNNPGTAVITFADSQGNTSASVTVTVTAAETVRYAYPSENSLVKGQSFDLVAVTEQSQTEVNFTITAGPAAGSYDALSYTTESRTSTYSKPVTTDTVRVFRRTVSFGMAGTYTVRARAGSGYQDFTVFVQDTSQSPTVTAYGERRCSTTMLGLIAAYEGSWPEIRDDTIASGNPTVGYGVVIQRGEAFYNNLTSSELYAQLVDKVNNDGYTSGVNRFRSTYNLKMSQAQFDALISFVYNCGTGVLNASSYNTPKVMLNAVVPPSGLSETAPVSGQLNVESSPIYAAMDLSSQQVTTAVANATVTVIGVSGPDSLKKVWYRVKVGEEHVGWIPAGRVQLQSGGLTRDLAWADSTTLANNFLQWCRSAGSTWSGLVYRRLAESKVFFFGDYAQASPSSSSYRRNTYGFTYPSVAKAYEVS